MQPAGRPLDETARLDALSRYDLVDSTPEQNLDDLAALAGQICETPISLITLVDEHRQWFKSRIGLSRSEIGRDISFCSHAILQRELFVVPDAVRDPRFSDNPLVIDDPYIRFYAGAPLMTPDGHVLGTLCVIDHAPRDLTTAQREGLRALSRQVMSQIELRIQARNLRRFAAIVESSGDAIVGKDMNGVVTSWNESAERIFGYSATEMIGTSITRLIPGNRLSEEELILSKVRRGEGVAHLETVRQTKGGTLIDVSVTTSPIRDADGMIVGVSKVARDISLRKHAESDAQRYLDTAQVIMLALDLNGRITLANRFACDALGWPLESLLGRDFIDTCVPERIRELTREKLGQVHAGDDSVVENPIVTRTGEERLIEWRTTFLRDDAGRMTGTLSSGTDITERKHAMETVRVTEERMRFALEGAKVGIWDLDHATRVLSWSTIIEAQHGLQPGTFAGTFAAFIERVHPDDREALLQQVDAANQSGKDFTVSYRALWPDGQHRWLNGTGRVLRNAAGEPVRAVGISTDVTERHTLEAQFQQSQKMEAVGRLAGGVAHDFNNLLTAILGFCELTLDDVGENDRHRADLEQILNAGHRAAALTRQLLAFSRKQIIEPTRLNLNEIVTNVRSMLDRLIGEDVTIRLKLSPALSIVKADRGQVDQIIMNLAVNARDAMPSGGHLTIETANVELDEHYASTHFEATAGPHVVLTVTDTGTGIPPEVLQHMFEPFFTTKEAGKGTGLGLATVHGIIRRGGGSVAVYSEVGHGTSFKVYFPVADAADTAVTAPAPVSTARPDSKTVLVVEDEGGLRELAGRLLSRLGYRVLTAANAKAAQKIFNDGASIDVLLTDVVMPGASGPELTKELLTTHPDLKVVYMSGYTEDTIANHGVIDPGVSFLHKPFTSSTLDQKIREALKR